MGVELTKEEISQFLSRREDINRLMQGPFGAFEIEKAERRAQSQNDRDFYAFYNWDPKYGPPCLTIIDFDHSSCEEGKNDVIEIHIKPKNGDISISDEFEKNIMDFRNYLFTDCLNTIKIHYTFSGPGKKHQYRTIQKKHKEDNMLEVVITGRKEKWNKKLRKFDSYDHTESTYRFYQYSGECTEENGYEGKTVTILFPDNETSQKKLMKNSPVIFRTVPLKNTVVKLDIYRDSDFFDSNIELPLYSPLFFTNAPFIEIDSDGKNPRTGEIVKIRSGIFATFEAFAKDDPNIAFKYIPTGDFLKVYEVLGIRKEENAKLNPGENIFFKMCRIIPTDKGLISLAHLFDKTRIDSNSPEYVLNYKNKETLGAMLRKLLYFEDKERDKNGKKYDRFILKKKTGKLLLWDKYGDETKNLCVNNVGFVKGSVGSYRKTVGLTRVLVKEYFNDKKNYYVEITADMFGHVRKTLFENPDKPEADEYVRTTLRKKRINVDRLFDALRERPWHKSFLTPGDDSSTILDDYIEELSELSIQKGDNGEIFTESFMDFDNVDGFTKLPSELYDRCKDRFGEDVFFDEEVIYDMTVSDIMGMAKYYDYKGDKTVYFWSGDREHGHLVIFGEKAFHKILTLLIDEFQ